MLAFLVVVTIGLGIGLVRGGSFRNLGAARLRLVPLIYVALGLQIGAQFVPEERSMIAYGCVIASYAVLFAFAGANFRVAGMVFIAVGAAMNYAVILANQGMPISAEAAGHVGFTGAQAARLVLRGKHVISSGHAASLWYLGDVIPLWRQPAVASAGDLVVWSGLVLLIQRLVAGPRGRRSAVGPHDIYEHMPPSHVGANPGDVLLAEIDLRDNGVSYVPDTWARAVGARVTSGEEGGERAGGLHRHIRLEP
jgi:hypothetical protein